MEKRLKKIIIAIIFIVILSGAIYLNTKKNYNSMRDVNFLGWDGEGIYICTVETKYTKNSYNVFMPANAEKFINTLESSEEYIGRRHYPCGHFPYDNDVYLLAFGDNIVAVCELSNEKDSFYKYLSNEVAVCDSENKTITVAVRTYGDRELVNNRKIVIDFNEKKVNEVHV